MRFVCATCGRVEETDDPGERWATSRSCNTDEIASTFVASVAYCSGVCMRGHETPLAIGLLFPAVATHEEEAAVRKNEQGLLNNMRSHVGPRLVGGLLGRMFADRERRYDARGSRQPQKAVS